MKQATTWETFFDFLDAMDVGDPERARWTALLDRNFALGHPSAWRDITPESPQTQERLAVEWLKWSLRSVQWVPLRGLAA